MNRVVHIGLGKAASTTLQKHVFPEFSTYRQVEFLAPHAISARIDHPKDKLALPEEFLASSEVLMGLTNTFDQNLKRNLCFFGANTTILIILRCPSGYLRSSFQQACHHEGLLEDAETFFSAVNDDNSKAFDHKILDQEKVVRIYAENFQEVIVQKFESISDLRFLRVAYNLSEAEMTIAQSNMQKKTSNRSFSSAAVTLSMKLKWMFGTPTTNPKTGKIKRTRRYQIWRDLMQGVFDKIYPYKKYVLDWDTVPNVDIDKMDAAYNKIPEFQHFINGKSQPVD